MVWSPTFRARILSFMPAMWRYASPRLIPAYVGGVASRKVSLKPQTSVHHFRDSAASAAGRTGIAPLMIASFMDMFGSIAIALNEPVANCNYSVVELVLNGRGFSRAVS